MTIPHRLYRWYLLFRIWRNAREIHRLRVQLARLGITDRADDYLLLSALFRELGWVTDN